MSLRVLSQPAAIPAGELVDWGPVPTPVGEPVSRTSGRLLHRQPNGDCETGVWMCTPGRWRCEVERDEFCQFLAGSCVYTEDGGTPIALGAGDAAFFPAGWRGTCEILETVRKTYMIR